jgi:murein L,D-transpeptidase YafK
MPRTSVKAKIHRVLSQCTLALCASLTLTSLWASSSSIPPNKLSATELPNPSPEELLIQIYKDLRDNRLQASLEKANLLVAAYPTFRLGHLVQGDLLMMQANPVATFGSAQQGPQEKLRDLKQEAAVRLQSIQSRPDPSLVPLAAMAVSSEYKSVYVADVARSRLYVFDNIDGKLRFNTDYYITQGKFGAHKTKEGDQRTPIGLYYINEHIPGPKLPDFYGPGALPINYPNDWDRFNKRDGHGIWLHGTPSDTYSRPPLASDGCIVLANQDIRTLISNTVVGKTIILIGENIQFVKPDAVVQEQRQFQGFLNAWLQDVASGNESKMSSYYADGFRSFRGDSRATWIAKQYRNLGADVKMRDVSLFQYPGQKDMIVSTFTIDTPAKKNASSRKRLYWQKEGSDWKIIFEGAAN